METAQLVLLSIVLSASSMCFAEDSVLGEGPANSAKRVPTLYSEMGRFCDVPADLLYAVAIGESGRFLDGQTKPWPWTLNVAGESFYFDSRDEQFEALMDAITEGKIVDIGPMQLNWRWKFERLQSPWVATDPAFNVNTAARIIRGHYDANPQAGWFAAVGMYHREADRPQDHEARRIYIDRIRRTWERL